MYKLTLGLLAIFILSCSPDVNKLVPYVDPGTVDEDIDGIQLVTLPKVDILFVIDDSGSMDIHQQTLSSNIDRFVQGIQANSLIDYHIGVVTSDMQNQCSGRNGRLQGNPRYVTKNTPNGARVLRNNLLVGANCGGYEEFFSPVKAALTPPLINGHNNGFYRPDAFLTVIFLTDSEDQSNISAFDFYNFLLGLKRNRKDHVIGYAVYIPTADQSCDRSGEPVPTKIEDFIGLVRGSFLGLCDPDYGDRLAEIGNDLARKVGMFIPLAVRPVVDTIKVKWGSQVVPNDYLLGWTYNPNRIGLHLGRDLELDENQPAGTKLSVKYTPAALPDVEEEEEEN